MFSSGAGTGHNVISKVKSGQVLQVVGQENGWFKVNVNGQTGYVSGDFVTTGGKQERLFNKEQVLTQ